MYTETDQRIVQAYHYGTRNELFEIQAELLNSRKKCGEFIDMFLEKYDDKMSYAPPGHPLWKKFRQKHVEYGEFERLLTSINYFIEKSNV